MYQATVAQWGQSFAQTIDFSPFKSILEVGCRQGSIAHALSLRHPKQNFYAIDNLESEIDHAKQYIQANLDFAVMDALALPFENQFDALISFNCLFWIQNKLQALRQFYQSLVPGGKAYLQFFATHGRPRNDRFVYQVANQWPWQPYFKRFYLDYYEITLNDFCYLLQQVGFIINRISYSQNPVTLSDETMLAHFIQSWASHKKFVPMRKQEQFFHEVSQAYLEHHDYAVDKPFTYSEYLLEVVCEKPMQALIDKAQPYRFGEIVFSHREAQILKHFLLGKSAKEIGNQLGISPKTIEFHLGNIKDRLVCSKRSEVYQKAMAHGFISLMFDACL